MIDNASFLIKDYSNSEFEKLTERLDIYCPIDKNILSLDLCNLRIKYYPNSNKLRIKNSLHCYYNQEFGTLQKAFNHNDFTFLDFQVVSGYLCENIFERSAESLLVSTNFEVGLNVKLDEIKPFDLLSRYMSFGKTNINEFLTVPPAGLKGKPIERMCFMSDYKIKLYDKSEQSKATVKDILRYEIVFTELRKMRDVLGLEDNYNLTLATLKELRTWYRFFNGLMEMYDSIRKIPLMIEPIPMLLINSFKSSL